MSARRKRTLDWKSQESNKFDANWWECERLMIYPGFI